MQMSGEHIIKPYERVKFIIELLKYIMSKGYSGISVYGSIWFNGLIQSIEKEANIRLTEDIDFLVEKDVVKNVNQLKLFVNEFLILCDLRNFVVEIERYPVENKSGVISIMRGGTDILLIDITIDPGVSKLESVIYGTFKANGPELAKCIADKISAISTDKLKRRVKDFYDIYLLSTIFNFNFQDIQRYFSEGLTIEPFNFFRNNRLDLKLLYENLNEFKNIESIPTFDVVWPRVAEFIRVFNDQSFKDSHGTWSKEGRGEWVEARKPIFDGLSKSSVFDK